MTNPLLLTVEQAAEQLGIGRSLAYRLVSEGQLGSIKVGRLRKVPLAALPKYIETQQLIEDACRG